MRQVKYKAWDKVEKEWIDIKHFGFENGELWYVQAIDKNERDIDPPYFPDSNDIELIEYTGMSDRDGVEVFEGDIVELLTKYGKDVGVVVFIEGCFKIRWDSKNKFPKNREMIGHYYINSKTKVIGNVYEQPELIEV